MRDNLLEIISGEELAFLDGLAERFAESFHPKENVSRYAKSRILLDWHHATENCFSNRPYRHCRFPLLSDADILYLLGTLYRFIEFGIQEDEPYMLKPAECPRFIRAFEKIISTVNPSALSKNPATGQEHYGNFIGAFGTLDEAREWLCKAKEDLENLGYHLEKNENS